MRHGTWLSLTACLALTPAVRADEPVSLPQAGVKVVTANAAVTAIAAGTSSPSSAPLASPFIDGCCGRREACGWVSGEWLFWWMRGNPIPVIATIGDTADPIPGALDQPGTRPVFGDSLSYPGSHGARLTAGSWLNGDRTWGWEASGFVMERQATQIAVFDPNATDPTRNLTVPFLFPTGPGAFAALDAMFVDSSIQIWSTDLSVLGNLARRGNWSLDGLIGVRYFDLDESLNINMPVIGPPALTGFDNFRAQNMFYAGQLGAKLNWRSERLSFDAVGKLALGSNHRALTISGIDKRDGVPVDVGVFFAAETNIGRTSDDTFAMMPEVQLKVGYDLTQTVRATAGYNFLYMTNVLRPGGGIDPVLSETRPAPRFDDTSFWAHGLSFGIEVSW